MQPQTTEQIAIAVSNGAAKGGAALTVFSGLAGWISNNYQLLSGVGVLCGVIVGVTGLLISRHYQRRRDRREQELHAAKMRKILGEGND